MDKNTPKQKRSPKKQNRKFHQKNRYFTTQKHNPHYESTQRNNKITLEILFYYIVVIHMGKKHKIKKYTIIIYNNTTIYKLVDNHHTQ